MALEKIKNFLSKFTSLGRVDREIRRNIDETNTDEFRNYDYAFKKYRNVQIFLFIIRILFYATVITSVSHILRIGELIIIEEIASYIGATLLLLLYLIINYISSIRKEMYYLKREILISKKN